MSYSIPMFKKVKSRGYQTLVRPHDEYAAEDWNPYNITTAVRLEHIQRAAACFVHHDYRHTTSVDNLINIFGWDHLHTRRLVSQLTMFDKIHNHLVNTQIPQLISPATFFGKHDHQLNYAISVAIDSCKFSFYPRSIRLRNQLPPTAVFAASPEVKFPIGSCMLYLISILFSFIYFFVLFAAIPVTARLYQNRSVA